MKDSNSRLLSLPEPAVNTRKHQPCIFRRRSRKLNSSPVSCLHYGMLGGAIEMTVADEERPKDVVHIYDLNVNILVGDTIYGGPELTLHHARYHIFALDMLIHNKLPSRFQQRVQPS